MPTPADASPLLGERENLATPPNWDAVIATLRAIVPSVLAAVPEVDLAYLYGSVARGQARPDSDIDVALVLRRPLLAPDRLKLELALEVDLAIRAGEEALDVRVVNDAPLLLQGAVATEGILLYSRDELARIAFEASTRSRYFDYLPSARRMASAKVAQDLPQDQIDADEADFLRRRGHLRRYAGDYVVLYQGKVIAHGPDGEALAHQVFERWGDIPFYIARVEGRPTVYDLPSPEVAR